MPPVAKTKPAKGTKKPGTRGSGARREAAPQGPLARAGARTDDLMGALWDKLLTGAAVGVTGLGLLAVFALLAGGYFMNIGERMGSVTASAARFGGFAVTRVTMKGGEGLTEREVMRALWTDERGSVLGRSIFHVDGANARARLEALGSVRHAAVTKLWPGTIHVSVSLRTPEALWQDGAGVLHLVDAEGVSLRPVGPTDYTRLPVIVGTEAPADAAPILAALEAHPDLLAEVAAIVSVSGRRYDLRFRNDFTAKLPEDGVAEALVRLDGLGAGTGKLAGSLDYIDLRDPSWAYYKPKD